MKTDGLFSAGAFFCVSAAMVGVANAHDFGKGDAMDHFLAGGSLLLEPYAAVTLLIATALLIALWDPFGFPGLLLYLALGTAAGFGLAVTAITPDAGFVLALAVAICVLAVAAPALSRKVMAPLVLLCATIVASHVLDGHDPAALPVSALLGYLAGTYFLFSAVTGLAAYPIQAFRPPVPRIAVRILASWTGAVAVLLLAFQLR